MPTPLLHGDVPFTLAQAQKEGAREAQLRAAVRRGDLQVVCRGVFLGGHVTLDLLTRARALTLALPAAATFARRTAAVLLGAALDEPSPLDVLLPAGARASRLPSVSGRTAALPHEDVARWHGVRVTTPVRTLLDLACAEPFLEALVAVDALSHLWPHALAEARERLDQRVGARGVRSARRVLAEAEPLTESPMETRTRRLLVDAGLPRPAAQHAVVVGGHSFRLDLAYPGQCVAVEYDGRDAHPLGLHRDRERAHLLREAGWLVLPVTAEHLQWPTRTVARVRAALAAASGHDMSATGRADGRR